MFEDIKARYEKGYIRDDQIDRYVALDVITAEQADSLKNGKKWTGGGYNNLIVSLCRAPLADAQLGAALRWLTEGVCTRE